MNKNNRVSPFKNKELLESVIKNSNSKKEIIEKLGLRSAGGNYKALDEAAKNFDIILPKFKSRSGLGEKIPNSEIFIENSKYSNRKNI